MLLNLCLFFSCRSFIIGWFPTEPIKAERQLFFLPHIPTAPGQLQDSHRAILNEEYFLVVDFAPNSGNQMLLSARPSCPQAPVWAALLTKILSLIRHYF